MNAGNPWIPLTNRELLQIEWRGHMLRYYQKRGDDMRCHGSDWERRARDSEAADAELERRGYGERYT